MTFLRLIQGGAGPSGMEARDPLAHLPDYATWLRSWGAAESTIEVRSSVLTRALVETDHSTDGLTAWLAQYTQPWTRSAYFSHLRSYFGWAASTDRILADPTRAMRRPRVPKGAPRPLTAQQIAASLEVATGRTRAYVLLAWLAGLRAHEVAKMRGEDVSAETIYVVGKAGKVAYVPTHPLLWDLAQDYPRSGWWFPSPSRKGQPVTASAVSLAATKVLRRVGVTEGSLHRYRHSFGTDLMRSGVSMRVVQELMRHESLATTQIYTAVHDDDRREAIMRLAA